MLVLSFVFIAVISYLLGSLNFGVILSTKLKKDDVRNYGSGNAGTTNMLRNYGKGIAALTIIGDMAKVFLAIFISFIIIKHTPSLLDNNELFSDAQYFKILIKSFSGFFCVLGHIFPCYFKFKGGKGVATAGGMVFAVDWRIALILLAIFIITVIISRYVSLGSLVMAVLYPFFIFVFYKNIPLTIIALIFTVVVFIAHRKNIVNLINHNENKIGKNKN